MTEPTENRLTLGRRLHRLSRDRGRSGPVAGLVVAAAGAGAGSGGLLHDILVLVQGEGVEATWARAKSGHRISLSFFFCWGGGGGSAEERETVAVIGVYVCSMQKLITRWVNSVDAPREENSIPHQPSSKSPAKKTAVFKRVVQVSVFGVSGVPRCHGFRENIPLRRLCVSNCSVTLCFLTAGNRGVPVASGETNAGPVPLVVRDVVAQAAPALVSVLINRGTCEWGETAKQA